MIDKRMSVDDIVAQLRDGMTIGIGGWATRRKPMAVVRAIVRSELKNLTIAAYGGPDVGMLIASGKVEKLIFAFVSLDHIPTEPHFKKGRQAGLAVWELDEGMFQWGLRAAAMRLPFLPTRIGNGTDVMRQPEFKTVKSPYADGEEFIAMPALKLDVALLHVHRADQQGNTLTLSPDPFFDDLMARAADRVFVTAEAVVSTPELNMLEHARFNLFERSVVTGLAEVPFGAHPTSAAPDYQLDLDHLKRYAESALSPEAWLGYRTQFVDLDENRYLKAVGGPDRLGSLKPTTY
jgi:glutaconate CoA-transferase subunit A